MNRSPGYEPPKETGWASPPSAPGSAAAGRSAPCEVGDRRDEGREVGQRLLRREVLQVGVRHVGRRPRLAVEAVLFEHLDLDRCASVCMRARRHHPVEAAADVEEDGRALAATERRVVVLLLRASAAWRHITSSGRGFARRSESSTPAPIWRAGSRSSSAFTCSLKRGRGPWRRGAGAGRGPFRQARIHTANSAVRVKSRPGTGRGGRRRSRSPHDLLRQSRHEAQRQPALSPIR